MKRLIYASNDRYAVYFTWKDDGTQDTFNCEDARERDMNIREMLSKNEFSKIEWCRIYKSGEYGPRKRVL